MKFRKEWLIVIFIIFILSVPIALSPSFWSDLNMMANDIFNVTDANVSYLNISGCGNGQVWKYSTTTNRWECAADATSTGGEIDTNASTACSASELLDGDNNCITFDSINITWSNSTFNTSYEWFLNSTIFIVNNTDTTVADTNISDTVSVETLQNITGTWDLNRVWSNALFWANLTGFDLDVVWVNSLWYGNISGLPVYSNSTYNSSYEWFLNATIFQKYNSSYEWYLNTTIFETWNVSYEVEMGHNTTDEVFAAVNNDTFAKLNNTANITMHTGNITFENGTRAYFGSNRQFCIFYNTTINALVSTNNCG